MEKLRNTGKIIITVVIVGILIIVAIIYSGGQHGNITTNNSADSDSATLSATSPTETPVQKQTRTGASNQAGVEKTPLQKSPAAPGPTAPAIYLITPVAGDIWKIGTQNTISWDKAPNITGSISLIDATTKQSVGVILPQVGPNQTSYSWNTRDILLDRTNPLKKNVVPGTYMIVVSFDSNNLQPIASPTFTITN